jgi:hypothetical protein
VSVEILCRHFNARATLTVNRHRTRHLSGQQLLDVDPVGMVRRTERDQSFLLSHYVNDRPFVASSFMSVAISQVFGTAMAGRCKDRPELVTTPITPHST